MENRKAWLGIQVIALVFGMMVVGCGGGEDYNSGGYVHIPPPEEDPLTGTVTVTSNIAIDYSGTEIMTLTADVSDLNGEAYRNEYQWKRDDVNISGERQTTYKVTSDDIGKKISFHVTNRGLSGEKSGEYTVPVPTTLNLTLKWDSNAQKKDTGITIERENGGRWAGASTSGNLTTTGTTITLTSWRETKFKIRTTYTFIGDPFYFKKDNDEGSELFDFTNGLKSFVLTNTLILGTILDDLFATEE